MRIDKVGALIAVLVLVALLIEPFVTFRANRIVSGKGLGLSEIFAVGQAWPALAVLAAGGLFALLRSPATVRFAVGVALLLVLCVLIGLAPAHLVTADNPLARVSPAGGFWVLFFAFSVLVTDAVAKLSFGPVQHLLALALAASAIAAILSTGLWSGLSVMQEYANHADTFWHEAARHVQLVAGSVAAAVVIGVPLGVACAKVSTLRAVTLPVLNIVQTIPSIAMFGLVMGDPYRWTRHREGIGRSIAARYRLCDPGSWLVPALDGGAQYRDGAAPARVERGEDRPARGRTAYAL